MVRSGTRETSYVGYIYLPSPLSWFSRQVLSLALAVLEITQKTDLRSACLQLLRAKIKGVPTISNVLMVGKLAHICG